MSESNGPEPDVLSTIPARDVEIARITRILDNLRACPLCGALFLPMMQDRHLAFHQMIAESGEPPIGGPTQ